MLAGVRIVDHRPELLRRVTLGSEVVSGRATFRHRHRPCPSTSSALRRSSSQRTDHPASPTTQVRAGQRAVARTGRGTPARLVHRTHDALSAARCDGEPGRWRVLTCMARTRTLGQSMGTLPTDAGFMGYFDRSDNVSVIL